MYVAKSGRTILRIHQARMKCLVGVGEAQFTGFQPGETQGEPGSRHSAQNLKGMQTNPSSIKSSRREIKCPPANMTTMGKHFEEDANQILEARVNSLHKEPKSNEDHSHRAGDESTEVPVQGERRGGTH